MSYLFISFRENFSSTSKSWNEFFNENLEEQYKAIQKRIPINRQTSDFVSFIESSFPSGLTKKYYISCSNFLREKKEIGDSGNTYLNNVVIRPELTLSMRKYLPDHQNIILIGDVYESGKMRMFKVKGLQLVDESLFSPNDMVVNAEACSSFTSGSSVNREGRMINYSVWTIDRVNKEESFFTPNMVKEIIDNCYTVDNPAQVRQSYEEWNKYMSFRRYYLDEQSKRNFVLNKSTYVEAYAVNKKEYKKDSSIYDDYILDNQNDFKRGDMVVLSSKVEEAEEFPLIRLDIDRNKKRFLADKVTKRGKLINEEEKKIRSLASDNVFITALDPNILINGKKEEYNKNFRTLLTSGYELGDRFKIISFDILPEDYLAELDTKYKNSIEKTYKAIDEKYKLIINKEYSVIIDKYVAEVEKGINTLIEQKEIELNSSLDVDVKLNNDKEIIQKIKTFKEQVKKKNKQEKKEKDSEYIIRLEELYSTIDIHGLYVERNERILDTFKIKLEKESKININTYSSKKKIELENKYCDDIRNEKIEAKERLDNELKVNKEKAIEEETIIRFSLYFRINVNRDITKDQIEKISKCKYIVYDNRAEKAKLKRQEIALENFYSGFVKNPYLSTYLFSPEKLKPITIEQTDWMWYLESLNERQMEAVRKAVSSNGIFLLQGPPGTGKTQVIAETVAQLVKKGKKVLISSETHKAIDNVFERLPKIAEIVPIRLIPSNNEKKKDNEYDPKYLLDNFYTNVSSNMIKAVNRFSNFRKNKEEFSEKYQKLELLNTRIKKNEKILDKANNDIKKLENNAKDVNSQISIYQDKIDDIMIELNILRRTKRHIENDNLRIDDDINGIVINDYRKKLEPIFDCDYFVKQELTDIVKKINSIKSDEIEQELSMIDPDTNKTKLEIRKRELREALNNCRDEDTDEIKAGYEEKYKLVQKEFIDVSKQLSEFATKTDSSSILSGIFVYKYLIENLFSIKQMINSIKDRILEIKAEYIESVDSLIGEAEVKKNGIEEEMNSLKNQIKSINESINDIQDRSDIQEIQNDKYKLETELVQFFKDFEITEPFKNVADALKIISSRWQELEYDFANKELENKEKIPMYEKISNYLSMKDVIEADRKEYTKDLFENANVFGITCTSNDRFSANTIEALDEYNIDNFDIKSVGVDVVIIDEVSKSSFIDLLIPILYGKTVILVGDHRQLPPMYEFSKLRDDDFEGLDENIISKDINKRFTKLNEECFFKTLFEKIPDDYKTMLVQQYRCHEQIMNVFNHFYQGELKLGFPGLNNAKNHNIKLVSNGRTIIEPDKHIYFVDCKKNETHEEDSTSMYNTGEAMVVAELLRKINNYFKINKDRQPLSIGIICTYGDQARKIKEVIRNEKIKTDAFKTDIEKMIVSTVDDFQGDERDIIIFSTVRNPENPVRSQPGFINAYQRVNVALSRARRLLIVVGNRKYLESKGVIYLPDVYGRTIKDKKDFRIYEEIIGTIEYYGKVISDIDVLEKKEGIING